MKDYRNMRVYVGTYAKYNAGSIYGKWLDISDYGDIDEFYEACRELHKDEKDPEFMFQDYENIPEGMISESYISEKVFEIPGIVNDLSDDEIEPFGIWFNDLPNREFAYDVVEEFRWKYQGEYDSERDFAESIFPDCYPEWVNFPYIDYAGFARDLFMNDYWFKRGYVFLR